MPPELEACYDYCFSVLAKGNALSYGQRKQLIDVIEEMYGPTLTGISHLYLHRDSHLCRLFLTREVGYDRYIPLRQESIELNLY